MDWFVGDDFDGESDMFGDYFGFTPHGRAIAAS